MIVSAMTLLVGHLTRKIVSEMTYVEWDVKHYYTIQFRYVCYSRYVWYTGVTTRGSFVVIFGTVGVVDTFGIDCTQRLAH